MSNFLMHTGPNMPAGGYKSKNYDPRKAHEYYEKHKNLRGRRPPRTSETETNERDRTIAERVERSSRRSDNSSGRPRYDAAGNKRTSAVSLPVTSKGQLTRIKQPGSKGRLSKELSPGSKGTLPKELSPGVKDTPKGSRISKTGRIDKGRRLMPTTSNSQNEKKRTRMDISPYINLPGWENEDIRRLNGGHREHTSTMDQITHFVDNIVFSSPVHTIAQLSDTAHSIVQSGQNFYIDHIRGHRGRVTIEHY